MSDTPDLDRAQLLVDRLIRSWNGALFSEISTQVAHLILGQQAEEVERCATAVLNRVGLGGKNDWITDPECESIAANLRKHAASLRSQIGGKP